MRANLDSMGGLHFSQRVLLALTQAGLSREDAYARVQTAAMGVWEKLQKGQAASFKKAVLTDPVIKKRVPPKTLNACFDDAFYIRHTKTIWQRVLKGQ